MFTLHLSLSLFQAANSLKCAEGLLTLVIAKPGKSVHYEATTPTAVDVQSYQQQQQHWNKSTEQQQSSFLDVNSNPESKCVHYVCSDILCFPTSQAHYRLAAVHCFLPSPQQSHPLTFTKDVHILFCFFPLPPSEFTTSITSHHFSHPPTSTTTTYEPATHLNALSRSAKPGQYHQQQHQYHLLDSSSADPACNNNNNIASITNNSGRVNGQLSSGNRAY